LEENLKNILKNPMDLSLAVISTSQTHQGIIKEEYKKPFDEKNPEISV
jgi:hypothetical protein